jgi:5'-nucleotidase
MTRPFILITGDDSIRAEGTILVKRVVEKFADFKIIATKDQQSAVSGKMNFRGGTWGTEIVDGVEAIWVDGSPVDSVKFAFSYLERTPDIVISGMNTGENVDNSTMASGTFAAALHGTFCHHIPSLALSKEVDINDNSWLEDHNGGFREELLDYPGVILESIIKTFLEESKTKKGLWNVNFPLKPTDTIKFTANYSDNYFPNRVKVDEGRFSYINASDMSNIKPDSDVRALLENFVSITPIKWDLTDLEELSRLNGLPL